MKIHDILETEQILEGPNDPHIFKAVFLAGGPGSGKSYVAQKLLKNLILPNQQEKVFFKVSIC